MTYTVRPATETDIPFIAQAIIAAEKSGTDTLSYTTIFGMSVQDAGSFLQAILKEKLDGCELSLSSFTIIDMDNQAVAACASWIEGDDGQSSQHIKSSLITYSLKPNNLEHFLGIANDIQELVIDRPLNTLQLEYLYVDAAHRGQGLADKLIGACINTARDNHPDVTTACLQLFDCNTIAMKTYQRSHFIETTRYIADNPRVKTLLPSHQKIIMQRTIR
jgi:GNAT superfamily N-acetyltransferase